MEKLHLLYRQEVRGFMQAHGYPASVVWGMDICAQLKPRDAARVRGLDLCRAQGPGGTSASHDLRPDCVHSREHWPEALWWGEAGATRWAVQVGLWPSRLGAARWVLHAWCHYSTAVSPSATLGRAEAFLPHRIQHIASKKGMPWVYDAERQECWLASVLWLCRPRLKLHIP